MDGSIQAQKGIPRNRYCGHSVPSLFHLKSPLKTPETSAVRRHFSPHFGACLCRRTAEAAKSPKRRNVEVCRENRRAGETRAQLCPRFAECRAQGLLPGFGRGLLGPGPLNLHTFGHLLNE